MLCRRASAGLVQRLWRGFKKAQKPFNEGEYVYTGKLNFIEKSDIIETFRVIDLEGRVVSPQYDNIPVDTLVEMYKTMVKVEIIDDILLKAQRQGKISFYMTSFGENAAVLGVMSSLKPQDVVYTQYREQAAFVHRGFTIDQMISQCAGNKNDPASGRQMPVHYTDAKNNMMCVSSPLGTKIPHVAGAGYGFRIANEDRVAVTFFGEGSSSEGDFHAGLNFAATLRCQTLFVCRNNKYAISTSSDEQFNTDGIAARGPAYGMRTLRVDGNDALAMVHAATTAREHIIKHRAPVLIEAMTYRIGDHSTSDYSALYREENEIDSWRTTNDPIKRLGFYLQNKGAFPFTDETLKKLKSEILTEVSQSLKRQSETALPKADLLFEQVYDQMTDNLKAQREECRRIMELYPEELKTDRFEKSG